MPSLYLAPKGPGFSVINFSSNYNFVIIGTIFDSLSVSNKSLFHLVVEAKLTVLEACQDQSLELEAMSFFTGLVWGGRGVAWAALMSAKRASQTAAD